MVFTIVGLVLSELFPGRCPACKRKTIKGASFVQPADLDDRSYSLCYCKACDAFFRIYKDGSWVPDAQEESTHTSEQSHPAKHRGVRVDFPKNDLPRHGAR
jgi:hypothetical protein